MRRKTSTTADPEPRRAATRTTLGASLRAGENASALTAALVPHVAGLLLHIIPHAPQLGLRLLSLLWRSERAKSKRAEPSEPGAGRED